LRDGRRRSYPITDPARPLGVQEVEAPIISKQSAHEGGKGVSPTHWLPLPLPNNPQVLISVRG